MTQAANDPPIDPHAATDAEWRIWNEFARVAARICGLLENAQRRDLVATVARYQQNRLIGAVNSLAVLLEHSPHHFGFDGAMILRGIYDLHLQALYVLHDPNQQLQRATLFSDYVHVERVRLLERYDRNMTNFAASITQHAERQRAEPALRHEYDRVRPNYLVGQGQRCRKYWYAGDLRTLATAVGYEQEYDLMQPMLSSPVHAAPFALLVGPPMRNSAYLTTGWRLTFRVLAKVMELHGWQSADELERHMIATSREPIFA
jgi:hypothetical protein